MPTRFDLLIKDVQAVDSLNKFNVQSDIGIKGSKITAVAQGLNKEEASTVIEGNFLTAIPGLIDTHVHLGISSCGFNMLTRAGVTTALDMSGTSQDIAKTALKFGTGITYGTLEAIIPGTNIANNDPSTEEIRQFVENALSNGSYGVKILGGHFPLTPAASKRMVRFCQDNGIYIAWHAGSTENGSDMKGMREAVTAAAGGFLHLPHINAYCRGSFASPPSETMEALELLQENPAIISESYLSPRNGANLICDENGIPKSKIVLNCLRKNNFSEDREGVRAAIRKGFRAVMKDINHETCLIEGQEGVEFFDEQDSKVSGSFDNINPLSSRLLAAAGRRYPANEFTVDALATDGGCIPRNVTLKTGIEFVRMGVFTMQEFVHKACLMPARMLNLENKGHLSIGADADITIFNPQTGKAEFVIVQGRTLLSRGILHSGTPTAFCTDKGLSFYERKNLPVFSVTPNLTRLNRSLNP